VAAVSLTLKKDYDSNMKSYKVYETKTGKYTLTENDFVVATIKAKSFEIAKQTIKTLNKALKEDGRV
jgi:hypothetical protein